MQSKKKDLIPPIQYQRGCSEFYKLQFFVDERVLIPRPETELLVEKVIRAHPNTVLEIGTGSGCIAISIAKNLAECLVTAVDISSEALAVAHKNAVFHQVSRQIQFLQGDLLNVKIQPSPPPENSSLHSVESDHKFEKSSVQTNSPFQANDNYFLSHIQSFDWIVANLPYIPTSRIATLDSSVKDFEPMLALNGGDDGFDLYRKLFCQIVQFCIHPKFFMGEIDITQSKIAMAEAQKYFPDAKVEILKDLTHRDRFILIHF